MSKQRRNRTGVTCLICRQKKIKCDRQRPACGGCVARDKAELCQYDNPKLVDSPESSSLNIKESKYQNLIPGSIQGKLPNENKANNNINVFSLNSSSPNGVLQESLDDKHIDFYLNSYHSNVSSTQGTMSWVSLLRKDLYLNAIGISSQKANQIVTTNSTTESTYSDEVDQQFLLNIKHKKNKSTHNVPNDNRDFMTQISLILSDGKLVWLLLDRFWKSELFLTYPFVGYKDFVEKLIPIIGPRTNDQIVVNLKKRSELTTVGILLVIMRLTSLSLYNFGKPLYGPKDADVQYLLDHPVLDDILPTITNIFNEISVFKDSRIEVFQFLLMKTCYELVAPEECDCVTFSSHINIGKIVQYAIHCSLNRDPTSAHIISDTIDKNQLRRMWYALVEIDSYQFILIGTPPIIHEKFYDTDLPRLNESQDQNELVINQLIHDRNKFYGVCVPLLDVVLNMRKKPKVKTVKEYLIPLESFASNLKSMDELLETAIQSPFVKLQKQRDAHWIIDSNSVLFMVYYHMLLFYNVKIDKDSSLDYLIKTISVSTTLYESVLFLDPLNYKYDLHKHFGAGILLFPKIELGLHRVLHLMFSILLRLKAFKMFTTDGISVELAHIVDRIAEICTRVATTILTSFVHLSDTYYHTWVSSKIEAFIIFNIAKVPKGTHYGPIETFLDLKFQETIGKTMHIDNMFQRNTMNDYVKILARLEEMEIISSQFRLRMQRGKFINSQHWGNKTISFVDKKWMRKLINDFVEVDDDKLIDSKFSEADLIGNNVSPIDKEPLMSTLSSNLNDITSPVDSLEQSEVLIDSFLNNTDMAEVLTEMVNPTMELFDFEKMFYFGGSDRSIL